MGQEASLPQGVENGDENLEQMARAPPSAVDPSLPPPPPPPRSGRKLINAMFRSNQQQQLQPGDLDPNNENGPGETDAEPDESRPANEPQSASLPNHEKPSPRKTIFPGGKNLINSMRNLSLRSKPKAAAGAADWEKQWDEDDEDSSEEEEVGPLHFQDPPVEEDAKLPAQTVPENQEVSVISSDDALEWDTAVQQNLEEKPDIQMFLPMLRVLGKGSFGKVITFLSMKMPRVRSTHNSLYTPGRTCTEENRERSRWLICHENITKITFGETASD